MISICHQHRSVRGSFVVIAAALLIASPVFAAKKQKADGAKKSPVVFSPSGGAFVGHTMVKLSTRSGSATIRYTLDGSDPSETSPVYSAPLQITNSTQLRARIFPHEAPPSASLAEFYSILDEDLANFSSNLPLVIIDSFGTNIVHEHKVEAAVHFIDAKNGRARLTNGVEVSGRCAINIRGRASLRYPKNSFTVKLLSSDGDSRAASIFGMPAESDWVLYAPYPDKTLMRDVLAYEMHRMMGHWAPHTEFAEVFVSSNGGKIGQRDYVGVYVFEERVKRDAKRVNIAKLTPADDTEPAITGGYIFKKDHIDQGNGPMGGEGFVGISTSTRAGYPTGPGGFPADPKGFQPAAKFTRSSSSSSSGRISKPVQIITNHFGYGSHRVITKMPNEPVFRDEFDMPVKDEESFKTTHTNEFYFVEPEPDEITPVQKMWLKRHLNEVEAALYSPNFKDPVKGFRAYIDPDSFIDYHLIVDTTKNVDGFRFSVFFTKDRGGKIKADPIWDWNLSFGNANGKQGWIPEYWMWPQLDDKELSWYRRLFEDPDFGQRYVDRWSELRTNVFATARVLARIDEMAASLQEAQKRNFEKWPILGRSINPNYFVGSSFEEEVNFMKKFIAARLDWIEKQFPPVPRLSVQAKGQGKAELSAPSGEIVFTLDGTDPRASGGGLSKTAEKYTGPVTLRAGQKLFARVKEDNRWSGPLVVPE
jgi:hypothetical protein